LRKSKSSIRKKAAGLLAALAAPVWLTVAAFGAEAEYNAAYTWDTVAYGGGGYVTGLAFHPTEAGLVYARTDVGGLYTWDGEKNRWWQLMDMFSIHDRNLYGVDGIALDPSNPDVIYICAGKYDAKTAESWGLWNKNKALYAPCDVLKSTDRGKSWTATGLNKDFWGNANNRWAGEPIMVDPQNGNVVYVVARDNKMYRSRDAAGSWEEVTSFPALPVEKNSDNLPPAYPRSIIIDSSVVKDGVCQRIFVGAIGGGVYLSEDAGETWSKMQGEETPRSPKRMALSADKKILYATDNAGLYRYKAGAWKNVTPGNAAEYSGVDTDPNDPETAYAIRINDDDGGVYRGHVFRTTDGGDTWTDLFYSREEVHTVPWYPANYYCAASADLKVNPHAPEQVWLCDWYGVWKTLDVNQQPKQAWINDIRGIEEMVAYTAISPSKGAPLIVGNGDNDGARWEKNVKDYPRRITDGIWAQDTNGLDFCEEDPNLIVRGSGGREWAGGKWGYSVDNGVTWINFPSFPTDSGGMAKLAGRIAVSAKKDPATKLPSIVAIPLKSVPYYSKDLGKTWRETAGLPSGIVNEVFSWHYNLASDRAAADTFYVYHAGKFYVSTDGGENFINTVSDLPKESWIYVEAAPGMPGEVWVSLQNNGLYASHDYGQSFTKVAGVSWAHMVTFGKEAPGRDNPTVFVYGEVNGAEGIFRSVDLGTTWVRINDDAHKVGDEPNCFRGDRQRFGVVYIGTNGRGYYYGEPQTPGELLDVEKAAGTVARNTGAAKPDGGGVIQVLLNGERLSFDTYPELRDGRVMVPMRKIFEALGATVGYHGAKARITAIRGEDAVVLVVGEAVMERNGDPIPIDAPPVVVNGRTLIPARAVAEALHAEVVWEEESQTVRITTD
jgi:photosystem II stability/assembly factor-like uncharacterized protein